MNPILTTRRHRRWFALGATTAALALVVAGCGTSDSGDEGAGDADAAPEIPKFDVPDLPMKEDVGAGEGEINILAWPGYAESGKNDPNYDWVTPFEDKTGCKANVKEFGTSDEAVSLMAGGGYDVVSASGDATLRLIASGDVEPVNTDLVPNYADIADFLKDQPFNSVEGQMYGIPHGWGANILMYNTDEVNPPPTSWESVFSSAGDYDGKVTAYDSPIYIADAALYLMSSQPDLGIKNPYALDTDQLAAAMDVLKDQKEHINEYWSSYQQQVDAFKSGASVIGTTWQYNLSVAKADAPVEGILPEEGSTGWSDTWMVGTKSKHKNCAYMWLDWIAGPDAQSQVAEWFGEAPANLKACNELPKEFCAEYHAEDPDYASQIWYWTTPIKQCLDGRTDVECTDYQEWTDAWTEMKG
jgi:putative spermidine/putrescine transport system substrate-binding protein